MFFFIAFFLLLWHLSIFGVGLCPSLLLFWLGSIINFRVARWGFRISFLIFLPVTVSAALLVHFPALFEAAFESLNFKPGQGFFLLLVALFCFGLPSLATCFQWGFAAIESTLVAAGVRKEEQREEDLRYFEAIRPELAKALAVLLGLTVVCHTILLVYFPSLANAWGALALLR